MDEGGTSSGHLSIARSLTGSLNSAESKEVVISAQKHELKGRKYEWSWHERRVTIANTEIREIRPKVQGIFTLAGEGHGVN